MSAWKPRAVLNALCDRGYVDAAAHLIRVMKVRPASVLALGRRLIAADASLTSVEHLFGELKEGSPAKQTAFDYVADAYATQGGLWQLKRFAARHHVSEEECFTLPRLLAAWACIEKTIQGEKYFHSGYVEIMDDLLKRLTPHVSEDVLARVRAARDHVRENAYDDLDEVK